MKSEKGGAAAFGATGCGDFWRGASGSGLLGMCLQW